MATKKNKDQYKMSRYNALKHGNKSVVLNNFPCTKNNCPMINYCNEGKKKETKLCILRQEAAKDLLKNGYDPLRINWDLLSDAMIWYKMNSMREHLSGEPGEGTRKWAETVNKIIANASVVEKNQKAKKDDSHVLADIIAEASELLEKKKVDREKSKATDTSGRVEKY